MADTHESCTIVTFGHTQGITHTCVDAVAHVFMLRHMASSGIRWYSCVAVTSLMKASEQAAVGAVATGGGGDGDGTGAAAGGGGDDAGAAAAPMV